MIYLDSNHTTLFYSSLTIFTLYIVAMIITIYHITDPIITNKENTVKKILTGFIICNIAVFLILTISQALGYDRNTLFPIAIAVIWGIKFTLEFCKLKEWHLDRSHVKIIEGYGLLNFIFFVVFIGSLFIKWS